MTSLRTTSTSLGKFQLPLPPPNRTLPKFPIGCLSSIADAPPLQSSSRPFCKAGAGLGRGWPGPWKAAMRWQGWRAVGSRFQPVFGGPPGKLCSRRGVPSSRCGFRRPCRGGGHDRSVERRRRIKIYNNGEQTLYLTTNSFSSLPLVHLKGALKVRDRNGQIVLVVVIAPVVLA